MFKTSSFLVWSGILLIYSNHNPVIAQAGLPPLPHPWIPSMQDAYCQSTPAMWPFHNDRLEGTWVLSQYYGIEDIPTLSCANATILEQVDGIQFGINLKWNESPNARIVEAANSIRRFGRLKTNQNLFCGSCRRGILGESLIFLAATYTPDRQKYETVLYMTCGIGGNELGGLHRAPVEFGILKRGPNPYIEQIILDRYKEILESHRPGYASQLRAVSHQSC